MKNLLKFLIVILFPISTITLIAIMSLFLSYVTSLSVYDVSEHPVTWLASIIVVIVAYAQSSPEEDNSSKRIEDTLV